MINLKNYPLALQLMMQTDGTVTQLIQLLTSENMKVVKLSENISDDNVLHRCICLQGCNSGKNWIYAESEIYLNNLSKPFVDDLMHKAIPIGELWEKYQVETYKCTMSQFEEISSEQAESGFAHGTQLLCRTYEVFNQGQVIMCITEKFPIHKFKTIIAG